MGRVINFKFNKNSKERSGRILFMLFLLTYFLCTIYTVTPIRKIHFGLYNIYKFEPIFPDWDSF